MPKTDWKNLEGKAWRLDVGSTQEEALSEQDPTILHVTTDKSIVMNGEVFCNQKEVEKLKKKAKKVSDPEFKVCVRKCIPWFPRKGMVYYFDNGIRYNISRILDQSKSLTIPNDGNVYYSLWSNVKYIIPSGTVITIENFKDYFECPILIREVKGVAIVKIKKDMQQFFTEGVCDITIVEHTGLYHMFNFETRKRYRKVINGKVSYEIPLPAIKVGDMVNPEVLNIAIYRTYRKKSKLFGSNHILLSFANDIGYLYKGIKRLHRISRSDLHLKGISNVTEGVFYIARAYYTKKHTNAAKNHHKKYVYGPKLKVIIKRDSNDGKYRIKKIIV